tara:strand:+ start:207 stop:1376 length:1170 start_codon:yes stop_codon:yes gene_type:complete
MSRKQINLWELGDKISVKLEKHFIDFINKRIKLSYKTKRDIHKKITKSCPIPFSTFKNVLKKGYSLFIPLNLLLKLVRLLAIPPFILQENVIAYKTGGGWDIVQNPKLPIQITPLFDMLIAHHIADGYATTPKNNRLAKLAYRQYNSLHKRLYIKKIESVFGSVNYRTPYAHAADINRVYFPSACSYSMFLVYNLYYLDFRSKLARVPKELFSKSWEHKLAFLLAVIIDDGTVDSTAIVIALKNKKLTKDLQKLSQDLGYDTTYTERTKGDYKEYGYLYILKEGVKSLWEDYLLLIKNYSEANLGYKGKQIEQNLKITERKIQWTMGNRELILEIISREPSTVNELSKKVFMTRQGVRYHVHVLEKQGKITRIGIKGENNYIYTLNKNL